MIRLIAIAVVAAAAVLPAHADNLYHPGNWSALSADRRAAQVGDLLTIVVYQTAESTATNRSDSSRSTNFSGGVNGAGINESGGLRLGGSYTGGGQVQRSERLVTQVTVAVEQVLPNGDLLVAGAQRMHVNGETSDIGVRGRVRPSDISSDNRVLSSRVADAQINYDGHGFVSRSARPGLINRVFRFLGLG